MWQKIPREQLPAAKSLLLFGKGNWLAAIEV